MVFLLCMTGCASTHKGGSSKADFARQVAEMAAPVEVVAPRPRPPLPPLQPPQPSTAAPSSAPQPRPTESQPEKAGANDHTTSLHLERLRNDSAAAASRKNKSKKSSRQRVDSPAIAATPNVAQRLLGSAVYNVPNKVKTEQPFNIRLWIKPGTKSADLAIPFAKEYKLPIESIQIRSSNKDETNTAGSVEGRDDVPVGEKMLAQLSSKDLEYAQTGPIEGRSFGGTFIWDWNQVKIRPRTPHDLKEVTLTLTAWTPGPNGELAFPDISERIRIEEPWPEWMQRRAIYYFNLSTALFEVIKLWLVALLALLGVLFAVIHFKTS